MAVNNLSFNEYNFKKKYAYFESKESKTFIFFAKTMGETDEKKEMQPK